MDRRPAWLWPNLLSLDAPLVAVAWFWMFTKAWRVVWLPDLLPLLVGCAVWCVYVGDRLMDVREKAAGGPRTSPRHQFHAKHRKLLTVLLVIGGVVCVSILAVLPLSLWAHGALILLFVITYFFVSLLYDGEGIPVVKNFFAGMTFSYGTAVGIHFYRPESDLFYFFLKSPEVILFGFLCVLNMTAIDIWEEARRRQAEKRVADVVFSICLLSVAGAALLFAANADDYTKAFLLSVMFAAGALYLVDRIGRFWSLDVQRVMADVAMLLPLPFFIFRTWNL